MYKILTPEYEVLLKTCFDIKQPLFIEGKMGIGKSSIPRQIFRQTALDMNRIFVEWSDLTVEERKKCIDESDKYFAFMDARTSQMDTTSLVGIPNMAKTDLLENIPYSWIVYFTSKKAAGVIFADELNLAPCIIQSITYSMIHDRVISDRRLADDVYVFAAGNRLQDKANTFDMPLPLRDRFAECELDIDIAHWIKWASQNNINPHLISFIDWKPANLYNADKVKAEKPSTPRGVERASRLLGNLDITDDKAHMLVSIACGESFATEFEAYCKVFKQLDWNRIIENPTSVKNLPIDQQYAISAGVADQFKKNKEMTILGKLLDVADQLREDFGAFSYRMIASQDQKGLVKVIDKLNRRKIFSARYSKLLLENVCP